MLVLRSWEAMEKLCSMQGSRHVATTSRYVLTLCLCHYILEEEAQTISPVLPLDWRDEYQITLSSLGGVQHD